MYLNEYQALAARTIDPKAHVKEKEMHALHGLAAEVGELHAIYQKMYQGHVDNLDHVKIELGDILWFIAEYCTAFGWNLSDIAKMNIEKLKARYPDGFDAEHSLHRAASDI